MLLPLASKAGQEHAWYSDPLYARRRRYWLEGCTAWRLNGGILRTSQALRDSYADGGGKVTIIGLAFGSVTYKGSYFEV